MYLAGHRMKTLQCSTTQRWLQITRPVRRMKHVAQDSNSSQEHRSVFDNDGSYLACLPAAGKSGHHCFQRCNDICHTVSKHLDSGRSVHEEACTLQKCAPTASFSPVQVPNKHKHGSFDFSGHKGHTPQFLGITRQRSPGSPLSPGFEQAGEVASPGADFATVNRTRTMACSKEGFHFLNLIPMLLKKHPLGLSVVCAWQFSTTPVKEDLAFAA